MRKLLLSLVLSCFLIFSFAFAVTVDLDDYDLPDLDTGSDIVYSNQLLYTLNAGNIFIFSSNPLTASSNTIYIPENTSITYYSLSNNSWTLQEEADSSYGGSDFGTYTTIVTSNYIVYDYDNSSNIIYQPTQNGGDNSMSTVLTDLGTVLSAVLSNATNLVTWISTNPLVYLWVIMAIIIAIISFVRGFIRGV